MNNKKLRSLGRSLRIGCIISVLVICLLMGAVGFNTYYRGMINKYQTYLHDLLALTLTEIDGDDLEHCIESGQKSDAFAQTQEFINRIKETYEIEYIYIVKPLNTDETDNMMNVMAGITAADKAESEPEVCARVNGDGTMNVVSSSPMMGKSIRSVCDTLRPGFIFITRSLSVVSILMIKGCITGTSAIYEYAQTATAPISCGQSFPERKIAVGPSAPPMMAMLAAWLGSKPRYSAVI